MRLPVIRSARLRRALKFIIPLVLMPLAVLAGALAIDAGQYALVILLLTLLSLALFACGFERRRTGTRRLILVALMTALSVAGRFVFAALPGFKPITAIVVITAIYLGGEAGFLTGALSALISNFYFGQGPWTPFQMFAWGMLGLLAGLLSAPLKRSRVLLALYGIFAGVAYSFIMDIWTVLWYNGGFSFGLYAAALGTALPYTIAYAVSNVVFLLILARPFGEKLARVRIKYGC